MLGLLTTMVINETMKTNYEATKYNSVETEEFTKSFTSIEYQVMKSNYSKVVDKVYKNRKTAEKYAKSKGLDIKKAIKTVFVK